MLKNIYLTAAGRTVKWLAISIAAFFGIGLVTYAISHLFNITNELALWILFCIVAIGMLFNIHLDSIRFERRIKDL